MPENRVPFKIGDKLTLSDISLAPEGAWVVRETMQFLRTVDGKSITSITPIEGATFPTQKTMDRFTLVYAGPATIEKSTALSHVFNTL